MDRQNHENGRLASLLRTLCEAELSDDEMICHDGGFRYAGDFMSMEQDLIEPAAMLDERDYRVLIDGGYIEEISPSLGRSGGFRVTPRGRALAYGG
ncbi:MAG TPA: hypothetical protein VKZ96_10205 [Thermomicrobiales bacterium]|nr:hypothetical protein [Thermomicrobiales bacterium]